MGHTATVKLPEIPAKKSLHHSRMRIGAEIEEEQSVTIGHAGRAWHAFDYDGFTNLSVMPAL